MPEQAPGAGAVRSVQAIALPESKSPVARVILTLGPGAEQPQVAIRGSVLEVKVAGPPEAAPPPRLVTGKAPQAAPRAATAKAEAPAPAPRAATAKAEAPTPAPRAAAPKAKMPAATPRVASARRPAPAPQPAAEERAAAGPARAPAAPAPAARQGAAPRQPRLEVRELGFQSTAEGSRVFVRTSAPPRFTISQEGERVVRVELPDTAIGHPNNARPLDTQFFPGAVAAVTTARRGRTTVLEIALREQVAYSQRVEGETLSIDFAPSSAQPADPAVQGSEPLPPGSVPGAPAEAAPELATPQPAP